jgi:hypothetical protein
MRILPVSCPFPLSRFIAILLLGGSLASATAMETATDRVSPASRGTWNVGRILDGVPAYLVERLPMLDPQGAVQISVQPHLGDFFHEDYVRVPVTVRWKLTSQIEFTDRIESYFSRGGAHAGDSGLAGTTFGAKWQTRMPALIQGSFVFGLDYRTPFSHSPIMFTDGYRHLQPYVTTTRMLVPNWRVLGYANLGANFFQHTNLPSNLGRNQLHANSLALAVGVARQWSYFRASLTARLASTALTSDEGRQNFQLRPEVAFPLRRNDARTQIMITLGGRAMWGPDGCQTNTTGGVRVNFHLDRNRHPGPSSAEAANFPL